MNQILRNDLKKYLIQTKHLFGNQLFLNDSVENFLVDKVSSSNSDITIIKENILDNKLDKEETILLKKILKSINFSIEQTSIITLLDFGIQNKLCLDSLFSELDSKIIIIFCSDIIKYLSTEKSDFNFFKNRYKDKKIITTYSLREMINKPQLKHSVWNDIKPILKQH